jgi:hypothetical protein
MAYNRRVDIIQEPAGQASTEAYPNGASDAQLLCLLLLLQIVGKFSERDLRMVAAPRAEDQGHVIEEIKCHLRC